MYLVSYRYESNDLETTPFSSENPYDGFKQIKRGREGRAFIKIMCKNCGRFGIAFYYLYFLLNV